MTNFEKYKDEIREITKHFDIALKDGKVKNCCDVNCEDCELNGEFSCDFHVLEWAAAEAEPTMTAEDAWELMKRIYLTTSEGGLHPEELFEIFGTTGFSETIKNNTAHQAKARIEAWEKKRQIKVGSILKGKDSGMQCIVTKVDGDAVELLWQDGLTGKKTVGEMAEQFEPTGRKLRIIERLLREVGK